MGSAWLKEDVTWGLQWRMDSARQAFQGAADHVGCCLGSHSSPREEATTFNDPRGTEGRAQAASGSLGNWRGCPGVSPFCFQLGMSWWRIFPSKQRIICSSPAPPPHRPPPPPLPHPLIAHQFSGQPWLAVRAFLPAHNWHGAPKSGPFKHHVERSVFVTQLLETRSYPTQAKWIWLVFSQWQCASSRGGALSVTFRFNIWNYF